MQRCRLRAVAEAEEEKVGLSFTANRNAVSPFFNSRVDEFVLFTVSFVSSLTGLHVSWQARGYTEEDSAGQSNIFAVEVCPL